MTNEALLRSLWHLKNAGWFDNTNLIIFGRNEKPISYVDLTQEEAINRVFENTNIKYITNFDLGHTFPRVTLINGSTIKIICNEKKKIIEILED